MALALLLISSVAISQWRLAGSFPEHLRLLPGQTYTFDLGMLLSVVGDPVSTDGGRRPLRITADEMGVHTLELRLLGMTLRRSTVEVVERRHFVPGGEAIGVLLTSRGWPVSQVGNVRGADGRLYAPARAAGVQPGDVLVQVAGEAFHHPRQLEAAANRSGAERRPLPIVVERNGAEMKFDLIPVETQHPSGPMFQVGISLRNPAAGIGTLTFWDPLTRRFGALGHSVGGDGSSARTLEVADGRIVRAHVHGVRPGSRGLPGEKLGVFEDARLALGVIEKNTEFGIFGNLARPPESSREAVPVALAHEVRPGKATMFTVLSGTTVEAFSVEILEVDRQRRPDGKGLVLAVTDPRLLQQTQGIVQGMSGSPIIQDGRLVGAVTHVFLNDPSRGYGMLAEWMVYEAGLAADGQDFRASRRMGITSTREARWGGTPGSSGDGRRQYGILQHGYGFFAA